MHTQHRLGAVAPLFWLGGLVCGGGGRGWSLREGVMARPYVRTAEGRFYPSINEANNSLISTVSMTDEMCTTAIKTSFDAWVYYA